MKTSNGETYGRGVSESPEIINELDKLYTSHGYLQRNTVYMNNFEREAFLSALKKLDDKDQRIMKYTIEKFSGPELRIRNLGEIGVIELLAKVGIFLNANVKEVR